MSQSRVAILGLFTALFAVGASNSAVRAQAAPAAPQPSHIAVVNLQQVYTTIQETTDSRNELKGMQGELDIMQKSHQGQINELQAKLANLKPDAPQHADIMNELDDKSVAFALEEKKQQVKMIRKEGRQLKQAFDEIQAAVADISKKRGIDLVLVNSGANLPAGVLETDNLKSLAEAIFNRSVLYASEKSDITAEVITQLDANFKKSGSGK